MSPARKYQCSMDCINMFMNLDFPACMHEIVMSRGYVSCLSTWWQRIFLFACHNIQCTKMVLLNHIWCLLACRKRRCCHFRSNWNQSIGRPQDVWWACVHHSSWYICHPGQFSRSKEELVGQLLFEPCSGSNVHVDGFGLVFLHVCMNALVQANACYADSRQLQWECMSLDVTFELHSHALHDGCCLCNEFDFLVNTAIFQQLSHNQYGGAWLLVTGCWRTFMSTMQITTVAFTFTSWDKWFDEHLPTVCFKAWCSPITACDRFEEPACKTLPSINTFMRAATICRLTRSSAAHYNRQNCSTLRCVLNVDIEQPTIHICAQQHQ